MILTLLALLLLAGLIFWVINLSQHVQDRVASQHAADAAVAGAAGWYARSLNTIAANNAQIARLIAAVAVMDALDEGVHITLDEQQALHDRLEQHLAGGPLSRTPGLDGIYRDLLSETSQAMEAHIRELSSTAATLERSGVATATSYADNGSLWRAIDAADRVNLALMEDLDPAVRAAATTGGEANLAGAEGRAAAAITLLPLQMEPPIQRGHFDDFERPVREGLIPEDEDDPVIARGPWDVLLGWRDLLGRSIPGSRFEGRSHVAHVPDQPRIPATGGAVSDARAIEADFQPIAYHTYGPLEWMLRKVRRHATDRFGSTRLDWYVDRLTHTKLNHVWPEPQPHDDAPTGLSSGGAGHRDGIAQWGDRDVVAPDWRTHFEDAMRIAHSEPDRIKETAFFVVQLKSQYPPDHPDFLSPGSYHEVIDRDDRRHRLVILEGWEDPRHWIDYGQMVCEWAWEQVWHYMVYFDHDLGIPPQEDDRGEPVSHPVYRVDHVAFAGVNVGDEADVRNPFAGLSPDSPDAPAPLRLDPERAADDDAAQRRRHLSVLAVARHGGDAPIWAERFVSGGPGGDMLAIAQAHVFNHHSWDLWTQSWQAEMQPVTDLDAWVRDMRPHTHDGESQQIYQRLHALQPLARIMLTH